MIWKKKDKKKDAEKELDKEIQSIIDMDDDEFLLSEEIDGYTSCAGLNAQRCSTEYSNFCCLCVLMYFDYDLDFYEALRCYGNY